jgi:hypothetical protein
LLILILQGACLEKVTGESVPLDARFYSRVDEDIGDPSLGGGKAEPFSGYEGTTVLLSAELVSENASAGVDIDFRVPDASVDGGMRAEGKLLLEKPSVFSLQVPTDLGRLEIQAFQDLDSDGPSEGDPFVQAELEIGSDDIVGIRFELVAGSRSSPDHVEAAPGAQGGPPNTEMGGLGPQPEDPAPGVPGDPPPGPGGGEGGHAAGIPEEPSPGQPDDAPEGEPPGDGVPVDADPFAGIPGPKVLLTGTLDCQGCAMIDLDLFRPDDDAPGGRAMVGKIKRAAGSYEISIPSGYGPIILEAFVDLDGGGPGPGDFMGSYGGNPAVVGRGDLGGIDIKLSVPRDGKMPMGVAPPPMPR